MERVWVVVPLRGMRPAVGRLGYGAEGLHAEWEPRCPGDLAVWDGHVAMIVNGIMVEAGNL